MDTQKQEAATTSKAPELGSKQPSTHFTMDPVVAKLLEEKYEVQDQKLTSVMEKVDTVESATKVHGENITIVKENIELMDSHLMQFDIPPKDQTDNHR